MSDWAPTYEFYTGEYGGRLPEAAFGAELSGAAAYVDWLIGFNEVTEQTAAAYRRAVCAALEAFAVYGAGESGFTIGSFSMSALPNGRTAKDIAREDAARELVGTGLLFQGIA